MEKPVVGRVSALPPTQHPADNPSTPAKVALGAQLFLDKRLSGSGNNNCQSCHEPAALMDAEVTWACSVTPLLASS
jgi:cytochrome c peroxidase